MKLDPLITLNDKAKNQLKATKSGRIPQLPTACRYSCHSVKIMIGNALFMRAVRTSRGILSSSNPFIPQRSFSFIFTGRRLDDIIKKELIHDKTSTEVADLWYAYHEDKVNVHGLVLKGNEATTILQRAKECPFFIQPIFRDDGYFMLVSQYQDPCHFLMAYLEDFKMDPTAAQPLLTFSVFDDYATTKDLGLVRAEILNRGIEDEEGRKVVQNMIDGYMKDDEYTTVVSPFNKRPEAFDLDDFLAQQNEKWRSNTTKSER